MLILTLVFGISTGVFASAEETDENVFDVTAYGAVADDLSDDGAAIQSAFDVCKEAGVGTVYFPAGTYLISKTVFFYSNQTILFEDGAVLKRAVYEEKPDETSGVFLCNWFDTADTSAEASAVACSNVVISGGTFDGSGAIPEEGPRNVAMINTCHAENVVITDCRFINNYNAHCIEINSSDNVTIENCEFDEFIGTDDQIRYNEMVQIDKCLNESLGSYFDGNSYRSLRGYNAETYIDYISPDAKGCNGITISGCSFVSGEYTSAIGNHNSNQSDKTNSDVNIFNNIFNGGASSRGYIVFDCNTTDIEIYNNEFYGGTYGVTVNADDAQCLVYNNEFYDCRVPVKGDVNAYDNHIEGAEEESGSSSIFDKLIEFFNQIIEFFRSLFSF